MDLFNEILLHEHKSKNFKGELQPVRLEAEHWVEMECFRALVKIKGILEDNSLRDDECIYQIEEIVNVFEDLGSECGSRHDFG